MSNFGNRAWKEGSNPKVFFGFYSKPTFNLVESFSTEFCWKFWPLPSLGGQFPPLKWLFLWKKRQKCKKIHYFLELIKTFSFLFHKKDLFPPHKWVFFLKKHKKIQFCIYNKKSLHLFFLNMTCFLPINESFFEKT